MRQRPTIREHFKRGNARRNRLDAPSCPYRVSIKSFIVHSARLGTSERSKAGYSSLAVQKDAQSKFFLSSQHQAMHLLQVAAVTEDLPPTHVRDRATILREVPRTRF